MNADTRFLECQRLSSNPVSKAVIAIGVATVVFSVWIGGREALVPAGLLGFAVGGGVIGLLFLGELRVEVQSDALAVRFFPLTRQHRYPWYEIVSAEARTYRPIRDFGGWGVRMGSAGKAYNVSGNRGVALEFVNGSRLLIGSQRADELALAIQHARGSASR